MDWSDLDLRWYGGFRKLNVRKINVNYARKL
jgi:hypothetical protein